MSTYIINNRRYRVTNRLKFVLSSLFLLTVLFSVLFVAVSKGVDYIGQVIKQKQYEAEQNQLSVLRQKYSFTIGDIAIEATSADEALNKLKSQVTFILEGKNEKISQQENTITALEEKYKTDIAQAKEVTKNDVKLYNEFSYAIEFPGSDMTLEDIKMIVQICKDENINPHLWLSMVKLESGFRSYAQSNKSTAAGWGQVLKGTGRFLYEDSLKLGKYNHEKMAINKEINARMSIRYLSLLIKESGSIEKALISYNGNELGQMYITIINSNLKKYAGITLATISKGSQI